MLRGSSGPSQKIKLMNEMPISHIKMIAVYRYVPVVPINSDAPVLPVVSFSTTCNINTLPTISMEQVENIWSETNDFGIVLRYAESDIYYFLLPADTYLPDTPIYHRMNLSGNDAKDQHCDYYAKPIIARFTDRLSRRLRTRQIISTIQSRINEHQQTVEFHETFLQALKTYPWDDIHDRHLVQHIQVASQEIVDTEMRYRPYEDGYYEAKHDFEAQCPSDSESSL